MTEGKSIPIKNVYYMLAYAFRALNLDEYEALAAEEFDHVHELLAAILAKGIARQIKQGLHHEYRSMVEDLTTVRGKIELNGTVANRMRRSWKVSCEYDELSADNILNQVLKSTAMLLLRHGDVSDERKAELRRTMLLFHGVNEIDLSAIRWDAMRFERGNASYRFLMSVCQLVCEGMLLTTDEGERKLARFLDDQRMSSLFENFVFEYYKAECRFAEVARLEIKWAVDNGYREMLPDMVTDIVLSQGNNNILIIDTKYRSSTTQEKMDCGVRKLHSEDLYQIFAYVKNKEAELKERETHRVSGLLLYAETDEDIQPNFRYSMSGNQISVKTLDLNRPFDEIRAQLDEIAKQYFESSGA